MKAKGGDKAFVSILLAISVYGLESVDAACKTAISEQIIQADYILNILSRLNENPKPVEMITPDRLTLAKEPVSNMARYKPVTHRSLPCLLLMLRNLKL